MVFYIVFQDKVNVDVTKEYLNIEIDNPHFLPVPSSAPKSIKRPEPDWISYTTLIF